MIIKSFKAPTLKEAMANVKSEMGIDAVILHTQTTKKGGIFGFHSKEVVEVIAAIEEAKQKGSGVISMNGQMVDRPVVLRAQRVMKLANANHLVDSEGNYIEK